MPTGIIMQSSSKGATEEAISQVLEANGYEIEEKAEAAPEVPVEPKREDFQSDEEFNAAQEQFETAQEEAEEAAEAEEEKKRLAALPKKSRKQKAIEKATAELREKAERLERENAELKSGKKAPTETPKVEELKAPKREDFKAGTEGDEEFDEAKFQYRYKMQRQAEQQDESNKTQNARMKANYAEYQTEVAAFKKEHADWDKVVGQALPITKPIYFAIVDLGKDGAPVTYYLGQHPEEIERLAEMTPYRAAIEVGRLADRLKSGEDPSKKPSTERTPKPAPKKIPDPVRPLSTSAASSTLTSKEAAKNKDYKGFVAAQRAGR